MKRKITENKLIRPENRFFQNVKREFDKRVEKFFDHFNEIKPASGLKQAQFFIPVKATKFENKIHELISQEQEVHFRQKLIILTAWPASSGEKLPKRKYQQNVRRHWF